MSERRKLLALSPTGTKIVGTRELVPATAECDFYENPDDPQAPDIDYEGTTDLEWDEQRTERDEHGEKLYVDEDSSIWPQSQLQFLYDFEPQVLALFSRREGHQAYAVYEQDDNLLPMVEGLFVFTPFHRSQRAHNLKLWPGYQRELSITENLMLAYHLGAISFSGDTGQVVW